MHWLPTLVLIAALASPSFAFAVEPGEMLQDAALEQRARVLSRELRCMVCQNQSIDDSDAPLARDLRVLVRERLQQGDSDDQVRNFLVARYGEFVLLKPRLAGNTLLLWVTPFGVLILLGLGFYFALRRRVAPSVEAAALTEEERRKLAEIINPPGR